MIAMSECTHFEIRRKHDLDYLCVSQKDSEEEIMEQLKRLQREYTDHHYWVVKVVYQETRLTR